MAPEDYRPRPTGFWQLPTSLEQWSEALGAAFKVAGGSPFAFFSASRPSCGRSWELYARGLAVALPSGRGVPSMLEVGTSDAAGYAAFE